MMSHGAMAPLMFGGMIVFMLIGFPVAFSLAAVGLFFGFIGIELGYFQPAFLQALADRVFGILSNELLLAVPFFTFMGAVLERSGLAEDLLEGMGQLFGPVRGGLAYAVVVVGAILGAMTGTVAASVIAMSIIALPVMMRYSFNMRFATGAIAASGTLAQLVPPSLVLIILADQLGRSVGDLYAGAIGPSIVQISIFMLFVFVVTLVRPDWAPALPPEARTLRGKALFVKVLWGMVPSLLLIFLVLGTIFLGLATPTEAGAMGAVGSMGLAAMHGRLTWPLLRQGMDSTMRITAMVVFILIGATVFTLVFRGVDGDLWIEGLLTQLPGGVVGFMIFVCFFVFLLAFFLDFFEIAFIIVPLLAPVAEKLGIDLIWFGVMLCVTMQTSFMHPPFGFALFYMRGVAPPSVKSSDIYWGAVPWVFLQLIVATIVILAPEIVTFWLDAGTGIDPETITIQVPEAEEIEVPESEAPEEPAEPEAEPEPEDEEPAAK